MVTQRPPPIRNVDVPICLDCWSRRVFCDTANKTRFLLECSPPLHSVVAHSKSALNNNMNHCSYCAFYWSSLNLLWGSIGSWRTCTVVSVLQQSMQIGICTETACSHTDNKICVRSSCAHGRGNCCAGTSRILVSVQPETYANRHQCKAVNPAAHSTNVIQCMTFFFLLLCFTANHLVTPEIYEPWTLI